MKHAGQIVGDTRSGKPIFSFLVNAVPDFPHPENTGFLADDHLDAYAVFEERALKAKRSFGEHSAGYQFYPSHMEAHFNLLEINDTFEQARARAGCKDAFELADLGRRLCRPEFKDV